MLSLFSRVRSLSSIVCFGSILASGMPALAKEPPGLGAVANHDHAPIFVQSRPVIERLPIKVIQPVDLRVSKSGYVFIADKFAKCVFRLASDGTVSLPLTDVDDLQRIFVDADDNVYVLTSDNHESQIRVVNPNGQSTVLHELNFAASCFARDSIGQFVVAASDTNRIVRISTEENVTELTRLHQPVADVIVNAGGQTEALLASGELIHISAGGEVTASGFTPPGSSRLLVQSDGSLIALARRANGVAQLVSASRAVVRPQEFVTFATVPEGTQAVGFDSLGNLCLANPDLRAITRVTSHFRIPCPHCGRPTDMFFDKHSDPIAGDDPRNF